MADIVDIQHATQLSNRLERFSIKATKPYRFNFRCPICGDSQKSKAKARGWLIENTKDQSFHFYCHNCGASLGFHNFLKTVDPMVYKDYLSAKYVGKVRQSSNTTPDSNADVFKTQATHHFSDPLKKIKKISQLKYDHPVKIYINKRQIPPEQHYRLYYAPKFMTWINTILPGKFPNVTKDHPRLIMPFLDKNGKCFGVSGRGFDPDGLRYITIMFEDRPKIFGLDKVDFSKPYKIVEGAIDSFFVNNAVAMAGADGNTNGLENIENATFVFDLEYRNKEILKRVEKIIDKGLKVCLFPADFSKFGKDINEFVLSGIKIPDIQDLISKNTYKGLTAKLKLTELKRC